jgi:epoxyqueuosine reductase
VDEARRIGFDDVALVRADRGTPRAAEVLDLAAAGLLDALPWLRESVPDRTDLAGAYPGARTVIVVLQRYFTGDHHDHVSEAELRDGAKVSRYAWGGDYHGGMRKRLRKLRKRLLQQVSPAPEVWIFNDQDAVLERAWAEASGLGFVGKSGLLISRIHGTWTFLGGLITDLDLGAPAPLPPHDLCGSCTRCLVACPTGALVSPGQLDVARCLTTWNIEHTEGGEDLLAGRGWAAGCDVCQEVCPWNRFAEPTSEPRYQPRQGHVVLRPGTMPADLDGTPLARPGPEGLARAVTLALQREATEATPTDEGTDRSTRAR